METTLALFVLAVCAQEPAEAKVDLSPASWPEGVLEMTLARNAEFGGANQLVSGESGVIAGTTGAPAVRAGLEALKQGGTAADAALTTAVTQVTLAMGSWVSYAGIFTMVYYDAEKDEVLHLNAAYNTLQGETDPRSIPASGASGRTALVPGFFAGIEAAHQRLGKLPFEEIFAPAIFFAEQGFPLSKFHAALIQGRQGVLARRESTKKIFLDQNGKFLQEGALFQQRELARLLRRVASEGTEILYRGEWAQKLVKAVNEEGGKMSLEDLAAYQPIWSQPIRQKYRGFELMLPAIPADGGVNLAEAFLVAEEAGLAEMGPCTESAEALFWTSNLSNLFGQSFVNPAVGWLMLGGMSATPQHRLSQERAANLWERMRHDELRYFSAPKEGQTGHSDAVVVIDSKGNCAAVVHSINTAAWGQTGIFVDGVSIPDSAIFQQDKIAMAGPGQRLPDPTEPLLIFKDGKLYAALSSIGGGLHQRTFGAMMNLLGHEMDLKQALDTPTLHLPAYDEHGVATAQVFEGEFETELLEKARALGLKIETMSVSSASGHARGYVIGAWIHPETGCKEAMATKILNAPAMGY
ncbi:MAG: hypothetical protein DWQ01_00570 [Planctomycetota bacterium]|nr:MAG: hypothetical protein DWQ01_00570 [Planctomycetota bacterium]